MAYMAAARPPATWRTCLGLGEAISPAIQLLHPAAATMVDTMVLVRAVAMALRWRDLVRAQRSDLLAGDPGVAACLPCWLCC